MVNLRAKHEGGFFETPQSQGTQGVEGPGVGEVQHCSRTPWPSPDTHVRWLAVAAPSEPLWAVWGQLCSAF
jgi:hypothetical protein